VETKIPDRLYLALVGRPNVGKSSLFNNIIGYERVLVHNAPGTTRDSIDTDITWKGKNITIVDTAGLKQKSRSQGMQKKNFETWWICCVKFFFVRVCRVVHLFFIHRYIGQIFCPSNVESVVAVRCGIDCR
jgi:GTPase Era involved in 16S rRNA processing